MRQQLYLERKKHLQRGDFSLTDEEGKLAKYLINMSEMGFGLTRDGVMGMAFKIVSKSQRPHPFKNGSAGRGWFEGFLKADSHCRVNVSC